MTASAPTICAPTGALPPFAVCPAAEDAYWQRCHAREQGHGAGLDYEDYAPAYCVGYVGCAQYGGDFADALPSLCANWARIKGGSRLSHDQALVAIRAAWDRVAAQSVPGRARAQQAMAARTHDAGTAIAETVESPGFPHASSFPVRRSVPASQTE